MQKSILTGCNVCGRNHSTESCSFLRELKPIQDTKTPSRARLTLPANLEVQNLADNSTTVVARAPFARSVQFGPFIAKHTQMLHPAINFPLRVFGKTEDSSYYLDTSDEETCNWMCLVAPAMSCKEQNLICYQMGQDIYYTVMKDIQAGEQLRVWYAPYYAVKMGAVPFNVDLGTDENNKKSTDHIYEVTKKLKEKKDKKNFNGMLLSRDVTQKLAEQLPAQQLGARRVPDRWRCKMCCAEDTNVVSFAKHLMSHYKRSLVNADKLLECHLCNQKFGTEKLLVKHKVVQHKVKVQRPQLLDNIEEDESAVVDTPEEANSDVLEENSDRMASIVIENLAGELPSQFPQSSSESIFVTNTEQIFSDTVTDNELQDRQNEALNVFLEQLQSNNSYRDSVQVQFASESSDGVNDLQSTDNSKIPHHNSETQRNDPTDKGTDLVLNDANIPSEYEPMEEETGPVDILASYKAEIVPTLTLVPQESNRENIISIMNSHVTLIDDNGNHAGILNKGEKSKLADSISVTVDGLTRNTKISKPELPNSIFDAFQSSNVASEEMLPRSCSENINNSLEEQYQPNENENPHPEATVPNRNNEVPDSVDCMISPAVMEADPVSRELQLSVEQDDVSSAFLELVSTPSFGDTGDQNQDKSTENPEEVEQTLHADLPLPDSFDLDVVSEGTPMLPAENSKSMDVGPPYNCDICNKEFHKADYLYRHLRKHTGEFTCVSCLAVFARKETLLNHSCFADASEEAESSSSLTCPYCQKKFRQKKFFKRHIAKHTGEWKCNKCQKFYSSKATLASHRCIKKSRTTHHCKVCNRQFHRLNYLKKHMLLHVENHPCSTCGKKLQSNEILQTHQLYCSRGKLLETVGETTCPHCNVTFSQLVSYRHHMYQHTYPFICRLCGARFKTESGRILHVCSESMVKCDACLKHFSSVFSLSRHQVVHGIPQFHCYECGLSFHHSDNYTSHICNAREDVNIQLQGEKGSDDTEETENISTVLDEDIDMNRNESSKRKQNLEAATSGSLVCDVCGEVYKTIHILKAHMQLHGERKFTCEICNKKFHRKDVLQEHHSVHQEAQIPCPVCNKKLKTKKSLEVHMNRHTGARHHSCIVCGKKFFQKGNLMKHALVHNPQAKTILTCDHCNKNFTSRDYLAQHMLEHTQGRIYMCHLCDKGFVKEHMLKGHMKKFHGGRIYVCPYCNMSVRHRNSIRRHLENRHRELYHEWSIAGFIDSLEADGNEVQTRTTLVNNTAVRVHEPMMTVPQTEQHITSASDVDLAEMDDQAQATVAAIAPLSSTPDNLENDEGEQTFTTLSSVQIHPEEQGAEILLTVSGVPLGATDSQVTTVVDQSVIDNQMELQVETEIQGDEIAIGNTFILSDGTIVQQEDGTGGGDILLYVLDPADITIDPGYA